MAENKRTLIIGGGIAGLTVASQLADRNLSSIIVEKESALGGHLKSHYSLFPHQQKASEFLEEALKQIQDNSNVEVLTNSVVKDISGEAGTYNVKIETGTGEGDAQAQSLEVGTIVIATGFEGMDANTLHEYSYTQHKNVITGLEFEELLNDAKSNGKPLGRPSDNSAPQNATVVLCTGSRDEKFNEFCCEVGCRAGLNHAYQLKDMFGDAIQVFLCYIDVRATGRDNEVFYTNVREKDVHLVRGRPSEISKIDDNFARFIIFDQITHKLLQIESDLIILETALVPNSTQGALNEMMSLETDDTGFLSASNYFQPVESSSSGIYIAGTASGPRDVPGTIANAALTAATIAKQIMGE
ncbi:MAG: CoB--CoM heterodisulfide reductase iron-sulfur subunit A family protein [Thermoplasmata archaeon]|nr:MAG: CoB--CoM heterodisulfide reductase iron-sulfur subunit A family protein [Thermoplasmata archaeon]